MRFQDSSRSASVTPCTLLETRDCVALVSTVMNRFFTLLGKREVVAIGDMIAAASVILDILFVQQTNCQFSRQSQATRRPNKRDGCGSLLGLPVV
jgi:hypothetical protein